jgi:hypothetical protein
MADQDHIETPTFSFLQSTEGQTPSVKTEDLVGEGKKFETTDALAYGKEMADRHILSIEAENQRLRDQLESAKGQGALLEELKAEMSKPQTPSVPAEATVPSSEPIVAVQDLSQQVRQVLAEEQAVNTANQNLAAVKDRMIEKFGEAWSAQGEAIASAKGLSVADLNELAAKSPTAFFELAGLEATQVVNQPSGVQGTINTEAVLQASTSGVKNNAYYTAKRKEMGDSEFYSNTSLQTEMLNNAHAMGDTFYKT